MKNHVFVISLSQSGEAWLAGRRVVLSCRADELSQAVETYQRLSKVCAVECVTVTDAASIADIEPQPGWEKCPIRYFAKEQGPKGEFMDKFAVIAPLNIRFFLPASNPDNIVSVRFLVSLGFHAGVTFTSQTDWDSLTDLYYYYRYMKVGNGTIQPFEIIRRQYKEVSQFNNCCDFGGVYFAGPEYIDAKTGEEWSVTDIFGNAICAGTDEGHYKGLEESSAYRLLLRQSDRHFLDNTCCARCPGWRICLGKFHSAEGQYPACRDFFTTIIES